MLSPLHFQVVWPSSHDTLDIFGTTELCPLSYILPNGIFKIFIVSNGISGKRS